MGAASSVGVDPTTLRKEYEAMAASAASDEELLKRMKKLIISAEKGDVVVVEIVCSHTLYYCVLSTLPRERHTNTFFDSYLLELMSSTVVFRYV